jgi:hypothetical protein
MNIINIYLSIFLIIYNIDIIKSFKINVFDSAIGKWQLLYSSNKFLKENKFNLVIDPCKNNIDEVCVKIKRYESNNIITYSKIVNCAIENNSCNNLTHPDKCSLSIEDGESCTLLILKTEKYIKSVGIFEFPYFAVDYISGMNPRYLISWKVDNILGRLYIYFDNNTYIFEKNIYDKLDYSNDRVTTNTFLVTNLLSFLLGKFLEKTIHIN